MMYINLNDCLSIIDSTTATVGIANKDLGGNLADIIWKRSGENLVQTVNSS